MTKADLIEKMAKDAGISKAAAGTALNSFFDGVTKALKKKNGKEDIELPDSLYLVTETNLEVILEHVENVSAPVVIVDSIQTTYTSEVDPSHIFQLSQTDLSYFQFALTF